MATKKKKADTQELEEALNTFSVNAPNAPAVGYDVFKSKIDADLKAQEERIRKETALLVAEEKEDSGVNADSPYEEDESTGMLSFFKKFIPAKEPEEESVDYGELVVDVEDETANSGNTGSSVPSFDLPGQPEKKKTKGPFIVPLDEQDASSNKPAGEPVNREDGVQTEPIIAFPAEKKSASPRRRKKKAADASADVSAETPAEETVSPVQASAAEETSPAAAPAKKTSGKKKKTAPKQTEEPAADAQLEQPLEPPKPLTEEEKRLQRLIERTEALEKAFKVAEDISAERIEAFKAYTKVVGDEKIGPEIGFDEIKSKYAVYEEYEEESSSDDYSYAVKADSEDAKTGERTAEVPEETSAESPEEASAESIEDPDNYELKDDEVLDEKNWAFDDNEEDRPAVETVEESDEPVFVEAEPEEETGDESDVLPETETVEELPEEGSARKGFFKRKAKKQADPFASQPESEPETEPEEQNSTMKVVNLGDLRRQQAEQPDAGSDEAVSDRVSADQSLPKYDLSAAAVTIKTLIPDIIFIVVGLVLLIVAVILVKTVQSVSWIGIPFFAAAYIALGFRAWKGLIKDRFKNGPFDSEVLVTVATLASFIAGQYKGAVLTMLFFRICSVFVAFALSGAKTRIAAVSDIVSDAATVIRGGSHLTLHPSKVVPGEIVIVHAGERIPLDGVVESGTGYVDAGALTGDSVPYRVREGDAVYAGTLSKDSTLNIRVTQFCENAAVHKAVGYMKAARERRAPAEKFVSKFSKYFTPAVLAVAVVLAVVLSIVSKSPATWVYRAAVLVVVANTAALLNSVPVAFLAGLGIAVRNGILIKGGDLLSDLNEVDTIVFDKTGTVTKGTPHVTQVTSANKFTQSQVLTLAGYAESLSEHPIAGAIMELYFKSGGQKVPKDRVKKYKEIPGYGVSTLVGNHLIIAGNAKLMHFANISFTESTAAGTRIYVAADGQYAGCILIADEMRSDVTEGIADLRLSGIEHTVLLTGDNADVAGSIAKTAGIEKYYADLMPDDKEDRMEEIVRGAAGIGLVAFMGDVNDDAPAFSRADIGVAIDGIGSSAALDKADVVIMNKRPGRIADAINIARDTRMIVKENIIAVLALKAVLILLGVFGLVPLWFAVLADSAATFLTVTNSMRLLKK